MPSFLSKVFGRKKDEKEESNGRASESSLLEGKFEAVSPNVSPTAAIFSENGHGKEKEKERDLGFSLFKAKSNTPTVTSPTSPSAQKHGDFLQLSLNLSSTPKDESNSRPMGSVFDADPDAQILLSESVIGERRLTPQESITLVRASSQAITARGLETLGIMHPHWYSASPDVQRRLISLFIHSLSPNASKNTLLSTSSSPQSAFESEIQFTRSPHDVAAVLRWGLRHLKLEGQAFGKNEAWYKDFLQAERASKYPPGAFSDQLVPLLPKAHLDALKSTLEIMTSLAAHTEANSTSGSKLSKLFGLWLVSIPRVEATDDWASFYARWERSGRILEHLFLAYIRDENRSLRMPTRLTELVERYPFSKTPADGDLLPRPRFSTRSFNSLFVRIETQTPTPDIARSSFHPLVLLVEAFKADADADAPGEQQSLWEILKKAAMTESVTAPQLNQIFAEDTIRLLSLIPVDKDYVPLVDSLLPGSRKRSISLGAAERNQQTKTAPNPPNVHNRAVTDEPTSPSKVPDWAEFSSAGFQLSTDIAPLSLAFLDKDVEVTTPKKASKKSRISPNPGRGRRSLEIRPTPQSAEVKVVSRSKAASIIQVDEAFVDFWSDALLDPISSDWPTFVLCKLKASVPGLVANDKRVEWLVLEQAFVKPPAPAIPTQPEVTESAKPRASSPRPSFKSDFSGTFSATRKRFSIFTSSRSNSRQSIDSVSSPTKAKSSRGKKSAKSPQVGEMGEILAEEPEETEKIKTIEKVEAKKVAEAPKIRVPSPKPKKSLDSRKSLDGGKGVAAGASLVAAAALASGAAAVAAAGEPAKPDEVPEAATPAPEPVLSVDADPIPASEILVVAEATADAPAPVEVPVPSETIEPVPTKEDSQAVVAPEPLVPATIELTEAPIEAISQSVDTPEPTIAEPTKVEEPIVEDEPVEELPREASSEHVAAAPVASVAEPIIEAESTEEPEEVASVQQTETSAKEPEVVGIPEPVVDLAPATPQPEPFVELAPAELAQEPEASVPTEETTPELPRTEDVSSSEAITPEAVPIDSSAVSPSEPEISSSSTDLPDVPIVEADSNVEDGRASLEPIHTQTDKASERSIHELPAEEEVDASSSLPPAPEAVVLAGETPGPQIALSSSEAATLSEVAHSKVESEPSESQEVTEATDETEDKSTETHPNGNGAAPAAPEEPVDGEDDGADTEDVTQVSVKEVMADVPETDVPLVAEALDEERADVNSEERTAEVSPVQAAPS
ncbi:hypothetical protein PC9H_011745 [Pleurotus ostreatus]|uniref:Meiotically up-regulated protein Msb1/Mug8 domain-containing protein n=1 Tax=Pleurotus ostreatus TaxID=5322 RepID=A0A8H6ZJC9_PLEOS|nr:uncharacterized protein PC9H_011745 [Pleurotus ostreatus]KAF7421224.1 hypothetical protein PC9H_011745 [Pleurotus ostreatus]KAJ8690781.1 hypothetical protein PTI98_012180 [Pleurotus ostreatus]